MTGFDQTTDSTTDNLMIQSYRYDVLKRLTNVYVETADAATFVTWNANPTAGDPYGTHITYDANGNIRTLIRNTMSRSAGGIVAFVPNNPPGATTEMDNLTYEYAQKSTDFYNTGTATKITNNRLATVTDAARHEVLLDDIENESAGYVASNTATHNYKYDTKGRITSDVINGITNIQWYWYDQVKQITYDAAHGSKTIIYTYNSQGQRLTKAVNTPGLPLTYTVTSYVYDGGGLLMGTYDYYNSAGSWKWRINELETYASSRTGVYDLNEDLLTNIPTRVNNPALLRFEITDHLGSVRAVVSGVKKSNGNAEILSLSDYHEFGMTMRRRSFISSTGYNYGYQGSEKEKGINGMYTTDFRMLDVRIGRWFMTDPVTNPSASPYSSMDNNPISLTDVLGLFTGGQGGTNCQLGTTCPSFEGSAAGGSNSGTSCIDNGDIFLMNITTQQMEVGPFSSHNTANTPAQINPAVNQSLYNSTKELLDNKEGADSYSDGFSLVIQTENPNLELQEMFNRWAEDPLQGIYDVSGGIMSSLVALIDYCTYVDPFNNFYYYWQVSPYEKGIADARGLNELYKASVITCILAPLGELGGGPAKGVVKGGAGVYDLGTTLGKYVGQSKEIMGRVTSHFAKGGKLSAGELNNAVFHSMPGSTKLQREVYEQFLINKYGVNNLLNVRNPMGGRMNLYNSMVDDVIKQFGLPK